MIEHLRRIVQDELRTPSLAEAVVSRVEADARAILYFFFEEGESLPSLVAKASSDPAANGELRAERDNLARIRERLPESIRTCVPRVRGSGEWRGHYYYLQDFVRGVMARSAIRPRIPGTGRADALADAQRAWEWLMRLQAASSPAKLAIGELGFRSLIDSYAASFAPAGSEAAHLDSVAAELARRAGERVPAVLCHGDYFSGNVLLDPDGVTVIDWRYFREAYHPCFDPMLFVATLRPSRARSGPAGASGDFRALFFEKHWTNEFVRSLFGTFLAKRGIDGDLFSFLCAMTLLELSVREYAGSLRAGERDAAWRERFLCFMENRDRFLIHAGPREALARRSGG